MTPVQPPPNSNLYLSLPNTYQASTPGLPAPRLMA